MTDQLELAAPAASDDQVVVDRGRLTHGDTKRLARLLNLLNRGTEDLDEYDRQTAEYEDLLSRAVESIPADWLPAGMTIADPGWINHVSQPRYEAIAQAVILPAVAGKKGASAGPSG